MIFTTAFAIGAVGVLLRSPVGVALVACLIVIAFAAACLAAGQLLSLWLLGLAVLGFNGGIAACFAGMVAFEALSTRHTA